MFRVTPSGPRVSSNFSLISSIQSASVSNDGIQPSAASGRGDPGRDIQFIKLSQNF